MRNEQADQRLRVLASWRSSSLLPRQAELEEVETEISEAWNVLRDLRTRAAEIRSEIKSSCPLNFSDEEFNFWIKIEIIDDDESCWEFTGSRHPEGYGSFRWLHPRTKKSTVTRASYVALTYATERIPENQSNHDCDNPPCCRPGHLYDGTHHENMQDRHVRNRYSRLPQPGTQNGNAKMTEEIVGKARELARNGMTTPEIWETLGRPASETVLRWAITGRTWKHINDKAPPVSKGKGGSSLRGKSIAHNPPENRMFTDEQIREIRSLRAAGTPIRDVAAQFKISLGMVSAITKRRAYAHVEDVL